MRKIFHELRTFFNRNMINNTNKKQIIDRRFNFVIESTSRCNLNCIMCPRHNIRDSFGNMNMETYRHIAKYFKFSKLITLDGWGEPLLNKNILEMIEIAKRSDNIVGFASNATLLDEKMSTGIVKTGLDFINISLDGATAGTYEEIRKNADFKLIISNIQALNKIKEKYGSTKPDVSLALVLMKKNINELSKYVDLAYNLKIKLINVKNLNVITKEDDNEQLLFNINNEKNEVDLYDTKLKIDEFTSKATNLGIDIQLQFSEFNIKTPHLCIANPLNNIFFSYEGDVSPCCNLGHNVQRIFNNQKYFSSALIFGNIVKENLFKILNKREYIKFRENFFKKNFPEVCKTCYLLYGI